MPPASCNHRRASAVTTSCRRSGILEGVSTLFKVFLRVDMMWGKRRDMTARDRLPCNAEPPAAVLAGGELTALDAFYCRNHGPFPDITREQWRLTVDGIVQKPLTLTYDELTSQFTPHSVVATLACAGNRRAELLKVRPIAGKDPCAHAAISTAEWRGARLAGVLEPAGGHP